MSYQFGSQKTIIDKKKERERKKWGEEGRKEGMEGKKGEREEKRNEGTKGGRRKPSDYPASYETLKVLQCKACLYRPGP